MYFVIFRERKFNFVALQLRESCFLTILIKTTEIRIVRSSKRRRCYYTDCVQH
jgi:hypothetical protein